jgi:low temperature requirement protein LtrA
MSGRDPHEGHRAATPLELLFDLTFVVAFGAAGNELAHALAEDHVTSGLIGFGLSMFAVCWAWINFSWFASAYDTDDWEFRLLTMLQMAGVLIFALGLPEMFESVHEGSRIDIRMMVAGYVVMRVAMVGQWLRVMRDDPARRECARTWVVTLVGSQAGWVALAFADAPPGTFFLLAFVLILIETAGPTAMLYLLYTLSMRATDPFHLILLAGTAAVLIAAVVLAEQGVSLAWCLVVVALASVVTIVGYEAVGHGHVQDHLSKLRA